MMNSANSNSSPALLTINDVHKSFGALNASDGINLAVATGEIHAVIGPNGAGKTTLVAQICGQLKPDRGTIVFDHQDITHWPEASRPQAGLVRSFQITSIFPDFSALQNVAIAVQLHAGHSFRFFGQAMNDESLLQPARQILDTVGLIAQADTPAYALAHGQQRQLELAMAMALQPKMMVLDEPFAGMGQEESKRIIELLRRLKSEVTILLIEHDMDAVFSLADQISVLVYGKIIATGSAQEIRTNPEVREAYLGTGTAGHQHA